MLQDCFGATNWGVFKTAAVREDSSVDLEEYASVVTSYISTSIDNIVPTKCYKIYPNQKPWLDCEVHSMLHARSTAFGDTEGYRKARYDLGRSIREAKRQYRLKLEGYYNNRKALQHVIKTEQVICGVLLPPLQDTYKTRVRKGAHNIIKDHTQPQHTLFTLLPSDRRYRSVKATTTRLKTSFYPQAVRLLNHRLVVEL